MIELAAAVIGDVDPLDAVLDRDLRILGGGDALERQRNLVAILDALDRAPVEPGLIGTAGHATAPGGGVTLGDVALAPAVMRGVDRHAEGNIAVVDGAADMVVDKGVVAAHVELEDARGVGGGLGDRFEPGSHTELSM